MKMKTKMRFRLFFKFVGGHSKEMTFGKEKRKKDPIISRGLCKEVWLGEIKRKGKRKKWQSDQHGEQGYEVSKRQILMCCMGNGKVFRGWIMWYPGRLR